MGYPPQPPTDPYQQGPYQQGPYPQHPTGGAPPPGYPPQPPPPTGPQPGMHAPLEPPPSYTAGSGGGGGSRTALIIALAIGGVVLLGGVGVVVFFVAAISAEVEDRQGEVVIADPVTPTSVPPAFHGVWEGRMIQLTPEGDYHSEWDLRLELSESDSTATGELYEQFGDLHMCSWDLTVEDAAAREMALSVRATDVDGSCVPTGDVWLTYDIANDELDAYLEAPWPDGTTTSSGSLEP